MPSASGSQAECLTMSCMETTTRTTGPARAPLAKLLATLAASAAAVHVAFARVHFREDWRIGTFFVAIAAVQVAEAVALVRRPQPPGPAVLAAVAFTNLSVAAVWIVTRMAGVDLGPERWTPRPAQAVAVACVVVETLLAFGCVGLLVAGWRGRAAHPCAGLAPWRRRSVSRGRMYGWARSPDQGATGAMTSPARVSSTSS